MSLHLDKEPPQKKTEGKRRHRGEQQENSNQGSCQIFGLQFSIVQIYRKHTTVSSS